MCCLHVYLCREHAWCLRRSEENSGSLELELLLVVSHHVDVGIKPETSAEGTSELMVSLESQFCWMVFCWGKHMKERFPEADTGEGMLS